MAVGAARLGGAEGELAQGVVPEPGVPVLVGAVTCPRCGGWMFCDPDSLACLNCGYVRYPESFQGRTYTRETRHMGHRGPRGLGKEGMKRR